MPRAPKERMKSIARIDQERRYRTTKGKWSTKSTHGWYVQVAWNRKKHTKFFSDGKFGGREQALRAAIEWRDAIERKIRKPQTTEPVFHPSTRPKGAGVSLGTKDGSPVYQVSWVDAEGRYGRTTVSIAKWGKRMAKERALAIRDELHRR